jgi:solute carrier family 26 (sodium-independent sulfate anion transporter), member 11
MKHNLTAQKFTGEVKAGLPTLQLPPISANVGNQTYGLIDMLSTIGSGSIVVPLLAILENIAIAKAFCEFPIKLLSKVYLIFL